MHCALGEDRPKRNERSGDYPPKLPKAMKLRSETHDDLTEREPRPGMAQDTVTDFPFGYPRIHTWTFATSVSMLRMYRGSFAPIDRLNNAVNPLRLVFIRSHLYYSIYDFESRAFCNAVLAFLAYLCIIKQV